MAKLFCLLNNRNPVSQKQVSGALDYHPLWQKCLYEENGFVLGAIELPFTDKGEFWIETEKYVLALDGEIMSYRAKVAGQFTADKLLRLYEDKGAAFVDLLNGNFTVIIWDKTAKSLFVASDRLGLRPLYYALYNSKQCFASEVKAITADSEFAKRINTAGVIDFLTYKYVLEEETFVAGVKVFPPSNYLVVDREGRSSFKKYWDIRFTEQSWGAALTTDYLARCHHVIEQAVERTLQGPLKIGLPLSGGLDSRMIGAVMAGKYSPLHTFTFGEKESDDAVLAAKLSLVLQSQHHYTGIKHERLWEFVEQGVFYSDGLTSPEHCPYFHMMDELPELVQVGLDGVLGDVLMRCMYPVARNRDQKFFYSRIDMLTESWRYQILAEPFHKEIPKGKERFLAVWEKVKAACPENPIDYFNLTQRQRRFINMGKVVKRNFLEMRMPFADYDYLDFALSMPLEFKKNDRAIKQIFLQYYPKLAKIPRNGKGGPLNPSKLETAFYWRLDSFKNRFNLSAPLSFHYGEYYRRYLRKNIEETLLSKELADLGVFNPNAIKEMLKAHFDGSRNYEGQIGVLLAFALSYRA